ncbi:MAG TPA: glycosyltransferase, partial [Vicinamibacterales bacterium]
MSVPDLSVVVPTYNRGAGLEAVLDRLLDQNAADLAYEVVVVDNNSTDDTREVVQRVLARDAT